MTRRFSIRPTLLDRYVARGFAQGLASTLLMLMALYVVVDAFQDLARMIDFFGREGIVTASGLLVRYYSVQFLSDVSAFGEILTIAPAVLVVFSMARTNEFVPMLAGGTSLRRIALPILIGCAAVGVGNFALRNLAVPRMARVVHEDQRRIRGEERSLGRSMTVQGSDAAEGRPRAVVITVERYDPAARAAFGFAAQTIESGRPLQDVRAPVAVWMAEEGRWRFPEGGTRWSYGAEAGDAMGEARYFATAIGPDVIEMEELGTSVLSLRTLWSQRSRPRLAAIFHQRLAQLLVPPILAVAALPFALSVDRARAVTGAVAAVMVVAAFEVAWRGMSSASFIPPAVSAWTAPAIFLGIGIWRMIVLRT